LVVRRDGSISLKAANTHEVLAKTNTIALSLWIPPGMHHSRIPRMHWRYLGPAFTTWGLYFSPTSSSLLLGLGVYIPALHSVLDRPLWPSCSMHSGSHNRLFFHAHRISPQPASTDQARLRNVRTVARTISHSCAVLYGLLFGLHSNLLGPTRNDDYIHCFLCSFCLLGGYVYFSDICYLLSTSVGLALRLVMQVFLFFLLFFPRTGPDRAIEGVFGRRGGLLGLQFSVFRVLAS